jgi:hypothetical protein
MRREKRRNFALEFAERLDGDARFKEFALKGKGEKTAVVLMSIFRRTPKPILIK